MAATQTLPESAAVTPTAELLISLTPLSPEALQATLANLALAFHGQPILVATPDPAPTQPPNPDLRVTTYTPSAPAPDGWILTASDFLNTFKLAQEHKSTACLLLGAEAQQLQPETLRALANAIVTGHADLTTPRYELGARDGLVNSAILYPVTRALFATRPRFPLAVDLAFSSRMAERLASAAQKFTASNQPASLIWPVTEAAAAGFAIAEVPAGPRSLTPPEGLDLNNLLAQIAGSFFADLDAKASIWQRARLAYTPKSSPLNGPASPPAEAPAPPDIQAMLDSFRLAYTNLHEIWSLVLPPNSLLGLKKLASMQPETFRMPDPLWARIVYDFILAYRLRTINRGHLLGALTPLYLAWVASHLLQTGGSGLASEQHIESLAAAFEADKPYLVSRWRWPDRFNP